MSRMSLTQQALEEALAAIVGPDRVKTDDASRQQFGRDWTRLYEPRPAAVVFPANSSEVQQVVRLANQHRIALVPSGGRTGLSGGAVATQGEVVVAFDRMNRIMDLIPVDGRVVGGAGFITERLHRLPAVIGLFFPFAFPSSA